MQKLEIGTKPGVHTFRITVWIVESPQPNPSVVADFFRSVEACGSRAARSPIVVNQIWRDRVITRRNAVGIGHVTRRSRQAASVASPDNNIARGIYSIDSVTVVVAKVEDRVAVSQRWPSRTEENCHRYDDCTAEPLSRNPHERTLPKAES